MNFREAILYGGLAGVVVHPVTRRYEPRVTSFLLSLAFGSSLLFAFVLHWNSFNGIPSLIRAGSVALVSLISFLVALSSSIAVYRLGPWHPLANYPGPTLAKLSKWWMFHWAAQGRRHLKLQELHEQYGPWLRTGPNEISVNIPAAVKPIYGHMFRAPFYQGAPQDADALITTLDRAEHARRLVAWNKAFTSDSIQSFRPVVQARTTQLVDILNTEIKAGRPISLSRWISHWAMDVMGDISFSGGFETMAAGKDTEGWSEMLKTGTSAVTMLGQMPWLRDLVALLPFPGPVVTFQQFAHKKVTESKLTTSALKRDILGIILDESSGGPQLTEKEAAADATLMVAAGTETVAQASMALFRHLAANQSLQNRLHEEVSKAFDSGVEDMDANTLGKLPFLDALVQETLRIVPPTPSGPPRYSGENGGPVLNRYIPPRTTIACPTWAMHRDSLNFKDADQFIPERWLDITHHEPHNPEASIPFSYGLGYCVGKQIALQNMKLIAATIMRSFELSLPSDFDVQKYDESYLDYSLWVHDDLMMKLKPRDA